MRNPDRASNRPAARMFRDSAVVASMTVATLLTGAGTASAMQVEPNAMTFGLLGPVGLIAVVLGVLGMAAGVIRQRRKTRMQAAVSTADSESATAVADAETGVAVASRVGD